MKKYLFCILFVTFLANLSAQTIAPNAGQVAYYKQVAVVDKEKKRSNGDNTGQFIYFTRQGCYDSNKERYDVGNGFLEYKRTENNIHVYYGNTYWGQGSYFFSNDFSRLNIQTNTGITYVYEKTIAPANVVTSSKINVNPEYEQEQVIIIPNPEPVNPVANPVNPINTWETPQPVNNRITCNTCNGTGKCKYCNGLGYCNTCKGTGRISHREAGRYTGENILTITNCTTCYGSGNCQICHGSKKCTGCNGKGYY